MKGQKRWTALLLALLMVFTMCPTLSAYAATVDDRIQFKILGTRDTETQYNGRDTMKIEFQVKAAAGVGPATIQQINIKYDNTLFELVTSDATKNMAELVEYASTRPTAQRFTEAEPGSKYYKYIPMALPIHIYTIPDTEKFTKDSCSEGYIISADSTIGYVNLQANGQGWEVPEYTTMLYMRLALREGKTWDEVNSKSLQILDRTDLPLVTQAYVTSATNGDDISINWGRADASQDTMLPPEITFPGIEKKPLSEMEPTAPTAVTAVATGATTATVSWTEPVLAAGIPAVDYYEITGDNSFAPVTTAAVTADLTGLTKGETYNFEVKAHNVNGYSSAAAAAAAVTTWTEPGVPTSLTVIQSGSASLRYTWGAPASNGGTALTGYTLTVTDATGTAVSGSPFALGASETTKEITGLTIGTTYKASITAANSVGTGTAGNFEDKEAVNLISAQPAVLDTDLSAEPVNKEYGDALTLTVAARATDQASGTATLSYQWYEAEGADAAGTVISGATTTAYTPTLKTVGTRYFYCVVTNTNDLSNIPENLKGERTATTKSATATVVTAAKVPDAPVLLTNGGDGSLEFTWSAPESNGSPITGYTLTVAEDAAYSTILTGYDGKALGADAGSELVEGLDNTKTYYAKLTATNGVGDSRPGEVSAQPYNGAYVEIRIPSGGEVTSGSAVIGTIALRFANGKEVTDPTRIPQNQLIVLRAKPAEGYKFVKWTRTDLGGGAAGSMEVGESYSLEQPATESAINPLTVKAADSSAYTAVFAVDDAYVEDGFQITDLTAAQTSGAAFDRARDLYLLKTGKWGQFGFDSTVKDYDLYLLKTDGTNIDFKVTALSGSAVTVGAVAVDLTEEPAETQGKLLRSGTVGVTVSDGQKLVIEAASPDGTETVTYHVNVHISTADPKIGLEVVQFEGSQKATLKVRLAEGYFDTASFRVKIKDSTVIEGFADKNYNVFTGTMDEEKAGTAGAYKDLQSSFLKFVDVTSLKSDGTELAVTLETPKGGAADLSDSYENVMEFYLKVTADQDMTSIVNALEIYNVGETKASNIMDDFRYGKLSGTEAGSEALDLVYLKEAEFFYITTKINSELTGENTKWITFDVLDNANTIVNDLGSVSVKPDGILEYRMPNNTYKLVIRANGYLPTTKQVKVEKDLVLSTLPLYAGELTTDNQIDSADRARLLDVYLKDAENGGADDGTGTIVYADFDGSGFINAYDLGVLLRNYGKTPVERLL